MSDLLLGRAARTAAVSLGRSCAAVLDIRSSSSNERLDPLAGWLARTGVTAVPRPRCGSAQRRAAAGAAPADRARVCPVLRSHVLAAHDAPHDPVGGEPLPHADENVVEHGL